MQTVIILFILKHCELWESARRSPLSSFIEIWPASFEVIFECLASYPMDARGSFPGGKAARV
jgi:hypothetical protein